jgi:hypothetical protein
VERLQHPDAHLFIHLDKKADAGPFRAAVGARARWISDAERVSVYWGGYSLLMAIMALITAARTMEPDVQRFALISGVDYPVRSIDAILAVLSEDRERIAITRRLDWDGEHHINGHASRGWLNDIAPLNPRVTSPFVTRVVRAVERRLKRADDYGIPLYHGGGWLALTRPTVDRIMEMVRQEPRKLTWFRWSFSPEELFFPSLLVHLKCPDHPPQLVEEEGFIGGMTPIHYIDWVNANPDLPRTLDMEDLPTILASGALFVRKIDPVRSAALMNALDENAATQG